MEEDDARFACVPGNARKCPIFENSGNYLVGEFFVPAGGGLRGTKRGFDESRGFIGFLCLIFFPHDVESGKQLAQRGDGNDFERLAGGAGGRWTFG